MTYPERTRPAQRDWTTTPEEEEKITGVPAQQIPEQTISSEYMEDEELKEKLNRFKNLLL